MPHNGFVIKKSKEGQDMFRVMNEKESMDVNGGFYYVPVYDKNGRLIGFKPWDGPKYVLYFKWSDAANKYVPYYK